MKKGKKFLKALEQVGEKSYPLPDAIELLKKVAFAKFDEAVEVSMALGVDPKHADQMVRGTVLLPHGLGKNVRVVVIAGGEKVREAREAGADEAGGDDIIQKIQGGWVDFDALVATPDMMRSVGKLGRILGPRGLMPNPKTGTVTVEVERAVKEAKAGKVEFRVDKTGNIHAPVGKASFEAGRLAENASALIASVIRAKPPATKGRYVKSVTVSSTMGPGIMVNPESVNAA